MTDQPTRPVPRNAPSGEGAKTDTLTPRPLLYALVAILGWAVLLLAAVAALPNDWTISVLGRVVYGLCSFGVGFVLFLVAASVWHDRG